MNKLYKFLHKEVSESKILNYLSFKGITWDFISPIAPHSGGIWQADVKAIKYNLKCIGRNSNFTFEKLYTVLVQIKTVLNFRTLTIMSNVHNDLNILTPLPNRGHISIKC